MKAFIRKVHYHIRTVHLKKKLGLTIIYLYVALGKQFLITKAF
jgi:hypothetical protein